jgi:L-fuconolactonase
MKIDAHHHFWSYSQTDYDWIDDRMAAIRRDFLPAELRTTIAGAGITHAISVQARQTLAETEWLLDLAAEHEFIAGVVGWVPLSSPTVAVDLAELATRPKLRGVRHVLQGEPDERYMLRPEFNRGIRALAPHDLTYDILIFERQLPQTIAFVDRHPNQRFVLDHIAKPRIREGVVSPWRENLRELARRPNVWCKFSGVVTEADYAGWTEAQVAPYFETSLEAFGPKRLMFGSDWPVCLVACEYSRWVDVVARFVSRLSPAEQDHFWWKNALAAYGLH